MPGDKLSGVYFGETVSTVATETETDEIIIFVVQTSTAITAIDGKLTLFDNYNAFHTVAKNKGLTRTLTMIDNVMQSMEDEHFYVYSVKTDTGAGFQAAVNSSIHLRGRGKVIYYEETKSANANTIGDKMTALKTACHNCYTYGAFRVAYVIPYGTISDAVTNADSGVTPESAVITAFTSLLSGDGDGRLAVINPDNEDKAMATVCARPFYEDAGFGLIEGSVSSLTYNFDNSQMLTLRNLGVIFIRPVSNNGITQYEIELGVSTGYKTDQADGLLRSRNIADEILHQVDLVLQPFVKDDITDTNIKFAQSAVNGVLDDNKAYIMSGKTKLTVGATASDSLAVSGQITTIKPAVTIEVASTIY